MDDINAQIEATRGILGDAVSIIRHYEVNSKFIETLNRSGSITKLSFEKYSLELCSYAAETLRSLGVVAVRTEDGQFPVDLGQTRLEDDEAGRAHLLFTIPNGIVSLDDVTGFTPETIHPVLHRYI